MSFISLSNPKSIDPETSILNKDYYRVFNFEYRRDTKCFYNNKRITINDCIEKIQIDGIECRTPINNIKFKKSEFKEDKTDYYKSLSCLALIFMSTYYFGKD